MSTQSHYTHSVQNTPRVTPQLGPVWELQPEIQRIKLMEANQRALINIVDERFAARSELKMASEAVIQEEAPEESIQQSLVINAETRKVMQKINIELNLDSPGTKKKKLQPNDSIKSLHGHQSTPERLDSIQDQSPSAKVPLPFKKKDFFLTP
jgi:flagellar biosynthesis/type III secretory pathway M-ring protein FliF/YscJ